MRNNIEVYTKSLEIEGFLNQNLKSNLQRRFLKDAYSNVVQFENGRALIPPSQQKKHVNRLLKCFSKAIDNLSKKHPEKALRLARMKVEVDEIQYSDEIYLFFQRLRNVAD